MRQQDFFGTSHLSSELREHALHSGLVAFTGQSVKFVIRLSATMILARIVAPEDYGLVAMVVAITGLFLLFKDLGLTTATIQKADITHEQVSTLFWINAGFGFGLMALVMSLAPVLAWFYQDSRLVMICIAISGMFGLSGLSAQHEAILKRQMRFGALMVVEVCASFLGSGLAVLVALWEGGYWALVTQQLTITAITVIGVWLACSWRPGGFYKNSKVGSLITFGGYLSAFQLVNYFNRNLDMILIGKLWGSTKLGFYNKAKDLLMIPTSQILMPMDVVATPTLSRLQDEDDRFRHYYLKAVFLLSTATMPLMAFLAVMSEEVIWLVLGPQWDRAAQIFRILAIAGFLRPVLSSTGWLFISTGRTQRMFKWGMFASSIIVIGFLAGLPWGPEGVACGYTVAILALAWPCVAYACHRTSVGSKDVFTATLVPVVSALASAGAVAGIKYGLFGILAPQPGWVVLLVAGFTMVLLDAFLLLIVFGRREMIIEFIKDSLKRSRVSK
jgi:PST family polysaccharide transporter